MANTSSFGFTNTTAATFSLTPVEIGEKTNYAEVQDDPTTHVRSNKTCPLDQAEVLTLRCNNIPKVNSSITVQNPYKVTNSVQYVIKLEEILRTVNSAGDIVGDEPIQAYLTIRHQKTANITSSIINTVVMRLLGACYKADGTARWDELMRSALEPTVD